MYAAVAGLKAHMSAMNVIGNNISNVNTNAYKATRYVFSEELYTSVRGGSDGTSQVGGVNPAQIGYGSSIHQIDLDMSTKNYSPTGRVLDCMIDGDGFFLVSDKNKQCTDQASVQGFKLTRRGDFNFDPDGYLVDGDGNCVYGFARVDTADYTEGNNTGDLTASALTGTRTDDMAICPVLTELRKPMCVKTTRREIDQQTGEEKYIVDYKVYYPQYDNTDMLVKDSDAPYTLTAGDGQGGNGQEGGDSTVVDVQRVDFQSISLDEKTGRISGITSDEQVVVVGYIAIGQVDNPNGVTHTDGHYYQALDGSGTLHVKSMGNVLAYIPEMEEAALGEGGGNTEENNKTPWVGQLDVEVGSAGKTALVGGGLESSGTDLATEISNMIMIQRGYQANTRIVTVTDSMLEELVNMKRG